ncbi:hypothetical protein V6N11_062128 [Hibiscus sabdariffa]|uniref:Retrotransposon gag domain-containing protein n=1 Tax=Hibiscus sabdariffa TaxID=183260 RepID=A0ABR2PRM3_9ROSI
MENFRKKHEEALGKWFSKVQVWVEDFSVRYRRACIACHGVPIHAWSEVWCEEAESSENCMSINSKENQRVNEDVGNFQNDSSGFSDENSRTNSSVEARETTGADVESRVASFGFLLGVCPKKRRFFSVAKASEIRRSILGIKQKYEESLYEYWERYKRLCASCPQHGLSDQTLVQYFYEGLLPMEMKMIDAASDGALFNMTPTQAKELILKMAANSQQFGALSEPNRRVHEVNNVSLENKIEQLTNVVSSLIAKKSRPFRACGICTMTDHPTDSCLSLQDESVNTLGNFPGPPQRPYNPYSNSYNPGWHDHPNLSSAPKPTYQPRPPQPQSSNKSSVETLLERFMQSQEKNQNRTDSRIQEIEKQMNQLTKTLGRLESQGKLPSQTEPNPKENVSAITLRSGTIVEPSVQKQKEKPSNSGSHEDDATTKGKVPTVESEPSPYAEPPPFPSRFSRRTNKLKKKISWISSEMLN